MRKTFILCFVALAASLSLTGCSALKNFLSRDLEDEDFIIGQLYVDEVVKETLYETVNSWLGVPYKYGGTDRNGIDCSAFVGTVFRQVYGVELHRTANDMLRDVSLISRSELREGDILFFTNSKGKVSHVGIYMKEGLFAHASTSNGVSVSRLDDTYWTKHFYKGGRIKK